MSKFWRRQKNKKEKLLDIVKIVFGQVLNVEECKYFEHWWEGDIITGIYYFGSY